MALELISWKNGLSTHRGTLKRVNEDYAYMNIIYDAKGDAIVIVAIADGMGGYQAGDIASRLIIDRLWKWETTSLCQLLGNKHPLSLIKRERKEIFYKSNQRLITHG